MASFAEITVIFSNIKLKSIWKIVQVNFCLLLLRLRLKLYWILNSSTMKQHKNCMHWMFARIFITFHFNICFPFSSLLFVFCFSFANHFSHAVVATQHIAQCLIGKLHLFIASSNSSSKTPSQTHNWLHSWLYQIALSWIYTSKLAGRRCRVRVKWQKMERKNCAECTQQYGEGNLGVEERIWTLQLSRTK